jgi:hypothetical protein
LPPPTRLHREIRARENKPTPVGGDLTEPLTVSVAGPLTISVAFDGCVENNYFLTVRACVQPESGPTGEICLNPTGDLIASVSASREVEAGKYLLRVMWPDAFFPKGCRIMLDVEHY